MRRIICAIKRAIQSTCTDIETLYGVLPRPRILRLNCTIRFALKR